MTSYNLLYFKTLSCIKNFTRGVYSPAFHHGWGFRIRIGSSTRACFRVFYYLHATMHRFISLHYIVMAWDGADPSGLGWRQVDRWEFFDDIINSGGSVALGLDWVLCCLIGLRSHDCYVVVDGFMKRVIIRSIDD
jgi:hypothetical protein